MYGDSRLKRNQSAIKSLVCFGGLLSLGPFWIISLLYYKILARRHLGTPGVQRVRDGARLAWPLVIGLGFGAILALSLWLWFTQVRVLMWIGGVLLIGSIYVPYLMAKRLAVLFLGVGVDKDGDKVFFPHDQASVTLGDFLVPGNFMAFGQVKTVPLSGITKITLGLGNELYLQGSFGIREINLSSRAKRKECLGLIQSSAGCEMQVLAEMDGYLEWTKSAYLNETVGGR